MQSDDQLQAPGSAHNAPAKHHGSFPASKALPPIEHAIRELIPSRRHADIIALFDHRAPYTTIQCWRSGRRSTPQWALDIVRAKTERINEAMRDAKTGPGKKINTRNILAWHARRKEKDATP